MAPFQALPATTALVVLATLATPCSSCVESYNDTTNYFAMASQQTQTVPREDLSSVPHIIDYGAVFNISYGLHFKVVTERYSKEQYILWLCGTVQPSEAAVDAVESLPAGFVRKYFTIPLQKVALSSTSQWPFFAELGLEDRIAYAPQWASSPCAQKLLGCGKQWEDSVEMRAEVEAVFVDSAESDAKSIVFAATFDPSNLGIAEHAKFLSAFFNKEEEANTYFQAVRSNYNQGSQPFNTAKKVAWISRSTYSWNDVQTDQFEISTAEYKAQYVVDAGAENVDLHQIAADIAAETGSNTTVQVSDIVSGFPLSGQKLIFPITGAYPLEQASKLLFDALMDVDAVIDESYAAMPADYKMEDFLMKYALNASASLPFLVNSKVFRIDGRISQSNGYDFFESRYAYPDLLLADVVRAITDGDQSSQGFTYLRNVATVEVPTVLDSAMCDALNCTAPTTTESDDASRGARGMAGPQWEFIIGAAAFGMLLRGSRV